MKAPAHNDSPDGRHQATRIDLHCHSKASDGPAVTALGWIDCPECYSEPEQVYDQARVRGMDMVTITDHDTIAGAMTLVERGYQDFIVGQEVTVYFPEDRCKLHVLLWGLTPELDDQITQLHLRSNVYDFAAWVRDHNLAHALAHPLYIQNGRLTLWHVERAALLFKNFETLNGAHPDTHQGTVERFLDALTPGRVHELIDKHGIEPLWDRTWEKGLTAGSDDHGLLNVGNTWTEVTDEDGTPVTSAPALLRQLRRGRCTPHGVGGHAALLAHQLATVGSHFYADRIAPKTSPTRQLVASKLLAFAGVEAPKPSKTRVVIDQVKRKIRGKKQTPLVGALKSQIGPVLDQYPDLRDKLDPSKRVEGAPISEHERMADFVDDLYTAISRTMVPGLLSGLKKRDREAVAQHLRSYMTLQLAQAPYVFSLFQQNKERVLLRTIDHQSAASGAAQYPADRPLKVALFTDTLGDTNGVCRFIQNTAKQAEDTGRKLHVITSTKFELPDQPNIFNFDPVFAFPMPRYEQLEFCLPPVVRILRHIDRFQPDVIHISTPGAVGMIGALAAKMVRAPVLGVYHTDFPAYIEHLFDDPGFTKICEKYMRIFYNRFQTIFTRSDDYVQSLVKMGLSRKTIVSLAPGVDTDTFSPRFEDRSIWSRLNAGDPNNVKVLSVGRVSVEKNLPFLVRAWEATQKRLRDQGVNADLIVVGDGPYREQMAKALAGKNAYFLGFRFREELSTLYASSDLFVFPSKTDTLGQVVMEAQACQTPVIVSDMGGPQEVVGHDHTGLVLKADDLDLWASSMVELITDDTRRKAMGQHAYEAMQGMSLANSFEHFWQTHVDAFGDHMASMGMASPTWMAKKKSKMRTTDGDIDPSRLDVGPA